MKQELTRSEMDLKELKELLLPMVNSGRTALLPALHAAQELYGWLPEEVAAEIGRQLRVPEADVYGVIDFYSMFYSRPVARNIARVCGDPSCSIAGGLRAVDEACAHLGVKLDEVSGDGEWMVERAPCLGLCEHAPAALVGDRAIGNIDPENPIDWLSTQGDGARSVVGGDIRILTRNCGNGFTTGLKEYMLSGGYSGLRRALGELTPSGVVDEIKASGLVGRGGAAFPTGLKWEGVAKASGETKYVVCNADESEPGTFKDRVLMEDDPHQLLEGMVLAGYAVGAEKGYIYVRGEYPQAVRILNEALGKGRDEGLVGRNIAGSGFDFDIEIRVGAGAYICGEETALFESIEGKRGFPRIKPPFPTTHGLFGRPTAINNVETLCNVPHIIGKGSDAFRKCGTRESPGPKLYCVSVDVDNPGLYEAPFGVTLRYVIEELAGGVVGGKLGSVLLGGAAGAFTTAKSYDVPLTIEDLRSENLSLGSGVLMVFHEGRDVRLVLEGLAHFFADESCGKCYPCQLGTQRQYEIIHRANAGQALSVDRQRLSDVGWTMTDASLCGLGQTAATAVLSALDLWPNLFDTDEDEL